MDNQTLLYWITRLDSLQIILFCTILLAAISALVFFLARMDCFTDEEKKMYDLKYTKYLKRFFFAGLVSAVLLVFIPSQKDVMIIWAGGAAIDYVQKDTSLQKLPYQTTEIISTLLDEKIMELKEK